MKLFGLKKRNLRIAAMALALMMAAVWVMPAAPAAAAGDKQGDAEAGKTWNDRYAVAIYGIRHDSYVDANGELKEAAGLTFGPAYGKYYLDKYRAHVTKEEYEENPQENLCLHWMSWEEIAAQSLEDPTVFHDCLVHGCTHAVDLKLNSKLLYKDYTKNITGDGAGVLLEGLKRVFLHWNKDRNCSDGWPASQIRAVLNGADELTNPSRVAKQAMLSADESLFSCFPEDLRDRIVAKAVVSDLGNDGPERNCVTTYDKLWLFSASELYGGVSRAEGEPYERNELVRAHKAGFAPSDYIMWSEKGSDTWAWFRSVSALSEVLNRHIYAGGHRTPGGSFHVFGIAPGFCLP